MRNKNLNMNSDFILNAFESEFHIENKVNETGNVGSKESSRGWDELIDRDIDHWMPLTFGLCISVAGAISDWLQEECIKIHLAERGDGDIWEVGRLCVACGSNPYKDDMVFTDLKRFEAFEETIADGYPCLVSGIPAIKEYLTEKGCQKHHKTIIAVTTGRNETVKNEGIPTAWLEVSPDVQWFKSTNHMIRVSMECLEVYGHLIPSVDKTLRRWGKEVTRNYLASEIAEIKKLAKERGIFQHVPKAFFKQIGMILVAEKAINERYGLHTRREDLIEFIFENVTLAWHGKIIESCHRNRKGETTWNMK